jgi:hypothetical protein
MFNFLDRDKCQRLTEVAFSLPVLGRDRRNEADKVSFYIFWTFNILLPEVLVKQSTNTPTRSLFNWVPSHKAMI